MLQRIVVAYDGSEGARAAYDAALMVARAARVGLVGVYVVELSVEEMLAVNPGVAMDPLAPPGMVPPVMMIERSGRPPEAIERDFRAFKEECRREGVPFESRIGHGTLVDWLLGETGAGDLLALGLKGRFSRTGVGSTTRALATRSACPVMVVKERVGGVSRLLAVFDATAAAEAALRFAAGLGGQTGWPVTVAAMARGETPREAAVARAQSLAPGARVLPLGDERRGGGDALAAEQIEAAAGGEPGALLVMGAYADSALKDLLLGSTTGNVLSRLGGAAVLVHG